MQQNLNLALTQIRENSIEVLQDENTLFKCSLDHSRYSVLPSAVVRVKAQEQVGIVLKIANKFNIGVTVRGSGTGCSGGCVPLDKGIVLDLSKLNKIEIDAVSRIATVEAGAITFDVDKSANEYGLFYAPDASSHKFCSIGGNIACNAGGLRALKYGVTRDNVISLKAYTGSGELVNCALPLKKFSVGLNLRDLFIGSEGLLGVIVEAKLKLLPLPESRKTLISFFDGDLKAFTGISKIMKSPLMPCVLEFMDSDTITCERKRFPELSIPEGKSVLLIEFDGTQAEVDEAVNKCSKLFDDIRTSNSDQEREMLWKIRRAASPAMYEMGDSKISQDIVLPISSLEEFFAYYKGLGKKYNISCPVFGHSGDGNYHIHFMYNSADLQSAQKAREAMDLSIKKTIELGGAVSGEHGIGFLKTKYMSLQHSEFELNLMRQLKMLFDPQNILNRSKVLWENSTEVKNLRPLKNIHLPWDK